MNTTCPFPSTRSRVSLAETEFGNCRGARARVTCYGLVTVGRRSDETAETADCGHGDSDTGPAENPRRLLVCCVATVPLPKGRDTPRPTCNTHTGHRTHPAAAPPGNTSPAPTSDLLSSHCEPVTHPRVARENCTLQCQWSARETLQVQVSTPLSNAQAAGNGNGLPLRRATCTG